MTVYEIPSLAALTFKLVLLAYATRSPVKNALTKLYLALLTVFSLFNIAEFSALHLLGQYGFRPEFQAIGYAYIAFLIPSIALILHLSLRLSTDGSAAGVGRYAPLALYVPAVVLEFLLLGTGKLVTGFRAFEYSMLRIPGPWYSLFETYMYVYLGASFVYLVYGSRRTRPSTIDRTRTQLWLIGITPLIGLFLYLILANHFGWTRLTSTFYIPMAWTFFLIVSTYATYQYRLFDIEFYMPWSRVRRRKTAFYGRIRQFLGEMAGLPSVNEAVNHMASLFGAPVALVGPSQVLSLRDGSSQIAAFPAEALRQITNITVAYEVAQARPEMFALMQQHRVGAIVPFYANSPNAAVWLLIGRSFSDEVYTPRDFRMVEQIFSRLADLFLESLLSQRQLLEQRQHELSAMHAENHQLKARIELLERRLGTVGRPIAADGASGSSVAHAIIDPPGVTSITFTGRDKALFAAVRERFAHAKQFVDLNSAAFNRAPLPDVLICKVDKDKNPRLLKLATEQMMGILMYGPAAGAFIAQHKQVLQGKLVEALPDSFGADLLLRRVEAIAELRKQVFCTSCADQPLIGTTHAFKACLRDAADYAPLAEPILIKAADIEQGLAVATYVHRASGREGALNVVWASELIRDADPIAAIEALCEDSHRGTLAIMDFGMLSAAICARALARVASFHDVRLLMAVDPTQKTNSEVEQFRGFTITCPPLADRAEDLSLLAQYFALQFNVQTGGNGYLTRHQIGQLVATRYPLTVAEWRLAVFDLLRRGVNDGGLAGEMAADLAEKNLDQHLAEYEAQIIERTLKLCGGNKSEAARRLGIRPNTLHYKMGRYGLA